jgi:hypothetical protein
VLADDPDRFVSQMRATIAALGSIDVLTLSDATCEALLAAFRGR